MKSKYMDFPKEGMKTKRSMNGEAHELPMNTTKFSKGGSFDPHIHSMKGKGSVWSPSCGGSPKS